MPSMPRPSSKATKIAFKILGTPLNLVKPRKRRPKKQDTLFT